MKSVSAAIIVLAGAAWYYAGSTGSTAEMRGVPFSSSWIAVVTDPGLAKLIGVWIGVAGIIAWVLSYRDDLKS